MSFDKSKILIEPKLIGEIISSLNLNFHLKNKFSKFEAVKNVESLRNICVLPNGTLVTIINNDRTIKVYDADFKVIKTIDNSINRSFFVASNNANRLYFTETSNNRLVMTNNEVDIIKFICSNGTGINQFRCPTGLSHFKDSIYVCDFENKRIVKLNDFDLEFSASYPVQFKPLDIKIGNNIAFITSNNNQNFSSHSSITYQNDGIYIFELNNFVVKNHYKRQCGPISQINSCFYEYVNGKLNFFNEEGNLCEEITPVISNNNQVFHFVIAWFHDRPLLLSQNLYRLVT